MERTDGAQEGRRQQGLDEVSMPVSLKGKRVLVTGGTSGLGKAMVAQLLEKGAIVHAFGFRGPAPDFDPAAFTLIRCNQADLHQVRQTVAKLSESGEPFDILINNAGILSPPHFTKTVDGFELSYQINFLSHVLLTRLLLGNKLLAPECIINVSSPIYTMGRLDLSKIFDPGRYGLFQTYADTKLFMALFSEKLAQEGHESFSFNPGIFSSGIYRQQKKWFHRMYHLAGPFMTAPCKVVRGLIRVIENQSWESGHFINRKGKVGRMKQFDESLKKTFWERVGDQLSPFLDIAAKS